MLDEALRLFDHHLGHLNMPRGRLVEGRGHDLSAHRALHVSHLLGPLIDEKHDEVAFRMIAGDRLGDVLQQHRLTRARGRDDEGALALADRRHDVDQARRIILFRS